MEQAKKEKKEKEQQEKEEKQKKLNETYNAVLEIKNKVENEPAQEKPKPKSKPKPKPKPEPEPKPKPKPEPEPESESEEEEEYEEWEEIYEPPKRHTYKAPPPPKTFQRKPVRNHYEEEDNEKELYSKANIEMLRHRLYEIPMPLSSVWTVRAFWPSDHCCGSSQRPTRTR